MSAQVRTTAEADRQILSASDWWRSNRPASPELFDAELAAAIEMLSHTPRVGRRLRRRGIPALRRMLLQRTRYHVYYVHDPSRAQVLVLAVWSAVRGRGPGLRAP